jgi:hypothetical protein
MRYLIDGYNLLHELEVQLKRAGPRGLEGARRRLLERLSRGHGADADAVTVVFDAGRAPPGVPGRQEHRGLRVLFALGQEADDLIEELIRRDASPAQLTVVSNDRRLRDAARRRSCPVLGCLDYLEHLRRPARPVELPAAEAAKPDAVSADEARRWEDEFGDLLREDPRLADWFDLNQTFDEEE